MNLKEEITKTLPHKYTESNNKSIYEPYAAKCLLAEFDYINPRIIVNIPYISFYERTTIIRKELESLPYPPSYLIFMSYNAYGIWIISDDNNDDGDDDDDDKLFDVKVSLEKQFKEFELDKCKLRNLEIANNLFQLK